MANLFYMLIGMSIGGVVGFISCALLTAKDRGD